MAGDVRLIRSPISVIGMVLTTVSAVLFVVVFLADVFGLHTNPYIGILFFLLLPGLFVIGLLLIPLGAWVERRRRRAGRTPAALYWPRIDLNDPTQRTIAVIVFALTLVNIVIVSLAAYRGVEYMDSVQFCGQTCHPTMKPEFVARERQPHANVNCVECHVGAGAASFGKAKLAGTRRVLAMALGSYPRPIVAAPEQLLSARETCERCHWPGRSVGDRIRRVAEYSDDEKNAESVTTLRFRVGGGSGQGGTGVHWHADSSNEIEYVATDRDRQVIPYVRLEDRDGMIREYVSEGATPEQFAGSERRRMGCMDCHNRPSHAIAPTAARAVNETMARGEIPNTLPFIHREAVSALKAQYSSQDIATREIARTLRAFFQNQVPASSGPDLERAIAAVQDIYRRNVFPEMNVTFGTYPDNNGHVDTPGCFRCHDDNHRTKEGKTIGQDCETCHSLE